MSIDMREYREWAARAGNQGREETSKRVAALCDELEEARQQLREMPCGHERVNMVISAETGKDLFCRICNLIGEKRDFHTERDEARAELTTEREAHAATRAHNKTLSLWANCGGLESPEVCSWPGEMGHKIFGPYHGIGDGKFLCEFHNFTRIIAEQAERIQSLTEELRIYKPVASVEIGGTV